MLRCPKRLSAEVWWLVSFWGVLSGCSIVLRSDAVLLYSVTVTGSRRPTVMATGRVYRLSDEARRSSNPFEALKEIPELFSDYASQTVSPVDGKDMLVLIDGKEVHSGIAPLDPGRMESVEIEDVVSARYLRRGVDKIMNIRLRRQESSLYTYFYSGVSGYLPDQGFTIPGTFELSTPKLSLSGDFSPTLSANTETTVVSNVTTDSYSRYDDRMSSEKSYKLPYSLMLRLGTLSVPR